MQDMTQLLRLALERIHQDQDVKLTKSEIGDQQNTDTVVYEQDINGDTIIDEIAAGNAASRCMLAHLRTGRYNAGSYRRAGLKLVNT